MVTGHANIKSATSIIDYIFRMLGYDYLDRTDLVHVLPEAPAGMQDSDVNPDVTNVYQPKPIAEKVAETAGNSKGPSFDVSMGAQSDAPACSNCGHTTIRSGTCYKCLNCGTSMGCS